MAARIITPMIFLIGITIAAAQYGLVARVLELKNSQLHFFSDFTNGEQQRFIKTAMEFNSEPTQITNIREYKIPERVNCSDLPRLLEDVMRKKSTLLLSWVQNNRLPKLLSIFNRTVSTCPLNIRPGYYYRDNSFVFIIERGGNVDEAKNVILKDEHIRKHSSVSLVELVGRNFLIVHSYNPFTGQFVASFAGTEDSIVEENRDIFPQFDMQGLNLNVAGLPNGYLIVEDYDPCPVDPSRVYVNQTGMELFLLWTLADHFNFTTTLLNPPDFQWGNIDDTGHWTGMMGEMINGTLDLALGFIPDSDNMQVMLPSTIVYYDAQIMVTPKPRRVTDYATFIHPLDWPVWLGLFISWLTMAGFLYWTSKQTAKWYGCDLRDWSTPSRALFFTYGTLIDHSAMRESNMRSAGNNTLRYLMVVWMSCTFIITAGYSACILTFMVLPFYEETIEDFKDVMDRGQGLTLNMIQYGTDVEMFMNGSTDPIIHGVWDRLVIQPFDKPLTPDRIKMTLERKWIVIEWMIELTTWVDVFFTTPDGTRLVHVSKYSPWPVLPFVWTFHPLNPFYNRINSKMLEMMNMGLDQAWKSQTYSILRERKKDVTKSILESWRIAADEEGEDVKPIAIGDIDGVFMLCSLLYVAPLVVFVVELGWSWLSCKGWFKGGHNVSVP